MTLYGLETLQARRGAIAQTKQHHSTLRDIYRGRADRETPAQTIARAVAVMGRDAVAQTVAEMVNSIGAWDGRIYPAVRTWAWGFPGAMSSDECNDHRIYTDIHSCHVNQLAQECMKL